VPLAVAPFTSAGVRAFANRTMLRLLACAALLAPASAWWKDGAVRERGEPPYPYPASHADGTAPAYDVKNEKDGIVDGKINVHLVPHTHDGASLTLTPCSGP